MTDAPTKTRLNESADYYPREIAMLTPNWRVIDGACGLQWILQRRGKQPNSWAAVAYCRSRLGLLGNIAERCEDVRPSSMEAVRALEERHP